MRALVTGVGGFVGRYLVQHLVASGDEVVGTFVEKNPPNLPCPTLRCDITSIDDVQRVLNEIKPDAIYHLAGVSFVPEAEANFEAALRINVGGTSNLFRSCHLLELPAKILFVSSAEVYGKIEQTDLPISETTPTRPANNYSLSKLMAELVAQRYHRQGIVKAVIARPFNHIGLGQDPRFVASSFAQQLAQIAKSGRAPVIEVGNLSARRDFSDVNDIVRGYRLCVTKGEGVYNFGSGRAVAIEEILKTLIEISGLKVEVKVDANRFRGPEVPELYCSYEKAKRELGWEPTVGLKESLESVYRGALESVS